MPRKRTAVTPPKGAAQRPLRKPKHAPKPRAVEGKRAALSSHGKKPKSRGRKRAGVSSIPMSHKGPHITAGTGPMGDYLRVKGREFVTSIVLDLATNDKPGRVLFNPENLVAVANTRLAQFAGIYQRWRPVRYRYHYVPTVPTTQKGSVLMAIDADPIADWTTTSIGNIACARTLTGSRMVQIWEPAYCDIPSEKDYTSLWCSPATPTARDAEDRLSAAGQLVFMIAAPTGLPDGSAIGIMELEYDVMFYHPRLPTEDTGVSADFELPTSTIKRYSDPVGRAIIGAVLNTIKDGSIPNLKLDADKILRSVRESQAWTTDVLPSVPGPTGPPSDPNPLSDSRGLLPGSYCARILCLWVGPNVDYSYWTQATGVASNTFREWSGGGSGSSPFTAAVCYDGYYYDGNTYGYAEMYQTEFLVTEDAVAGYSDFQLRTFDGDSVYPDRLIVQLRWAATPVIHDLTTGFTRRKRFENVELSDGLEKKTLKLERDPRPHPRPPASPDTVMVPAPRGRKGLSLCRVCGATYEPGTAGCTPELCCRCALSSSSPAPRRG